MNKLLIVKNISREGPGLLERILQDEFISYDVVDLSAGQSIPSLDSYKAMVVLGGPDSANDDTQTMKAELARVREAVNTGMPYLGICLGLQVLVKAAGGNVIKGNVKEVGFRDPDDNQHTITLTEEGKNDPLFAGLPDRLDVFQLHGETVELTPDMALLATGEFCRNQVVKVSEYAYGIQSHFELTPEMLAGWAEQDPDLMPLGKKTLRADFEAIRESYTRTGMTLFRNFLTIAGPL